ANICRKRPRLNVQLRKFSRAGAQYQMERSIIERRRLPSPAATPQALAYRGDAVWMGSRDLRRIYKIDIQTWAVLEEADAPGIPWAAVSMGDCLRFTIGEGPDDD